MTNHNPPNTHNHNNTDQMAAASTETRMTRVAQWTEEEIATPGTFHYTVDHIKKISISPVTCQICMVYTVFEATDETTASGRRVYKKIPQIYKSHYFSCKIFITHAGARAMNIGALVDLTSTSRCQSAFIELPATELKPNEISVMVCDGEGDAITEIPRCVVHFKRADYTPKLWKFATCTVCGKFGNQACRDCHSVNYCTRECQVKHWTHGHKDKCHKITLPTLAPSFFSGATAL